MILAPVHLLIFTSTVLAVGLAVVLLGKRRQEHAVGEFSEQLRQLTSAPRTAARIDLEGKPQSLERLAASVNQLLENLEQRGADLHSREELFQRLVETVHYAALVHRERILFANSRFLALLGLGAADVVGRHLSDFVGPEYVELVGNNLRRRLEGEPVAERYEVELIGAHGEVTRVELSSAMIERNGEAALLLTALEMLPEASTPPNGSAALPRAAATLDAMGESVITVDAGGRIDYINTAAELLLGQRLDQVVGKSFPEVASLVDEADRHSLGDPVRMALLAGGRVSMGRRAVLVPANGGIERSVELSVSPLRTATGEAMGLVLVLHDTSELRGLTRQMTYQASHDALTGLVNRREFERRLQEALDLAQTG
ncbi:MAG TPA: PAS domain S-box protein, partial [Steroidobacteraceae bacterium]|nr:PAS domain S-box protein [Steroidobacteraceae bacterium]